MRQSTLARKLAFGAVLLAGASSAYAAAQAVPLPVRVQVTGSVAVTNTPANPVPVSGSVNLNGTPTVKLNGAVVIDDSTPLRVRDIGRAPLQPFQAAASFALSPEEPEQERVLTVVPRDKVLVIETVDVETFVINKLLPFVRLRTCLDGLCIAHSIAVPRQGDLGGGTPLQDFGSATLAVKFYAAPGSTVSANFTATFFGGATAQIAVSGHFVDVLP